MIFEQEQLMDISCDTSLKDVIDADKLPEFWLLAKNNNPHSSHKAIKVLLPFVTTYLCTIGFSDIVS
jgi:hypothetical protein